VSELVGVSTLFVFAVHALSCFFLLLLMLFVVITTTNNTINSTTTTVTTNDHQSGCFYALRRH
jgi:hypothetical protein